MADNLSITFWAQDISRLETWMLTMDWMRLPVGEEEPTDAPWWPFPEHLKIGEYAYTHIGPCMRVPPTFDEDGNQTSPGRTTPGEHYNCLMQGDLARQVTSDPATGEPLPQTDEEGNLLPWVERTSFNQHVLATTGTPVAVVGGDPAGVPAGFQNGTPPIRWYDVALITGLLRGWA